MNDLRERVAAQLDLDTADPVWLEMLDQAVAAQRIIAQLEALVLSDGLVSTGSKGQAVIHPAVQELRYQRAAYARLLGELGLDDDGPAETIRERQTRIARKRRR